MSCNFTFAHYSEILRASKGTKIEIVHDVDFPPNNVEELAAIEAAEGVSTKYFIRLHARYYNALSLDNIQLFKRIRSEFGHELGLHFEPPYYKEEDVTSGITLEASILEAALETSIKYISLHCTSKGGTIPESKIPPELRLYSFDSPYYATHKYLSDSGGRWREGCVCTHLGKHESIILLTHPNWWYRSNPSENF